MTGGGIMWCSVAILVAYCNLTTKEFGFVMQVYCWIWRVLTTCSFFFVLVESWFHNTFAFFNCPLYKTKQKEKVLKINFNIRVCLQVAINSIVCEELLIRRKILLITTSARILPRLRLKLIPKAWWCIYIAYPSADWI